MLTINNEFFSFLSLIFFANSPPIIHDPSDTASPAKASHDAAIWAGPQLIIALLGLILLTAALLYVLRTYYQPATTEPKEEAVNSSISSAS